MTFVRKGFFWGLTLAILLLCVPALAATSTTEYALDSMYGKLALADSYIVLTPANLAQHPELISQNKTEKKPWQDWTERGVLLQAWVPDMDACLEVRLVQDGDAATYFNLDAQTTQARAAYRASHLKGTAYTSQGYTITTAEWKRTGNGVRFLRFKYKRNDNGLITRGYCAKTIHNGWTLILDYQVYNRQVRQKDLTSLEKVYKTVVFTENLPIPATTTGLLKFTSEPPRETNTGSFTVEGTCTPGAHLIGVIMKYANPTPTRIEADAGKNGKFKMNVKLPTEGIWLMTLTVEANGSVIAEEVFGTTTYQSTMLPMNLDTEVPEQFENDTFVLSGTTSKAVYVQCIVTGGEKTYDKTVRTNGKKTFSFKIPTDTQSEYNITLVLQKKNYETRRFTWTANRTLTERDTRNQYKAQAVKPGYSTLTRKIDGYKGRVMGYKVYITDIQQSGEEWIVFAALTKTKKGALKDTIVIVTGEKPDFVVGSEQTMYGTLTGVYEVQSEEDKETYPSFDLLFWEEQA